ncbi:MAG: hypothetical protein ACLQPD_04815 [Desulfomonilaceae bacterium]
MGRATKFYGSVYCEECGKEGKAQFEEIDNTLLYGNHDPELISLPESWTQKGDKYYCEEHSN